MNLAGRVSPSGPKVELQLPFYGAAGFDGSAPGVYFVTLGSAIAIASGPDVEVLGAYMILQRGVLGTFLVQNVVAGDDAVNVTYRVRRNGQNMGDPVIIGNSTIGPVRVDLTQVGVAAGNLISISATVPAFDGDAPVPKIGFTWFPLS